MRESPQNRDEFMARYPRITAHIIAESLGYATPTCAANIGFDGMNGEENWCEWIYACYHQDARRALKDSIRNRHYHKGYMAEYRQAFALVAHYLQSGKQPIFASWF